MIEERILAAVAAYLDGEAARALALPRAAQQKILQRFLACCYDDVAKEPRLLEGDELSHMLRELLPRHFGARDPLAPQVDEVLNAYFRHLRDVAVVPRAYELGVALDTGIEAFVEAVGSGRAHQDGIAITRRFETVQRGSKVGRNDPCPCGSGKKFKKCCMQIGDG